MSGKPKSRAGLMQGISPTVREDSIIHIGALPNGRASAP
ncbi:MAG: hypothetical protein QOG23_4303 [Blastocatellia bacterium]|jgi:hypothetical protein|nr:hypothetical protein [Blastocatellia bacterium]